MQSQKQKQTSRRIIFTFPNLGKLWAFAQTLSTHNLEINTRMNSLICDCTEVDVQRAVAEFGATIFQDELRNN